jgi:hypothetical protein
MVFNINANAEGNFTIRFTAYTDPAGDLQLSSFIDINITDLFVNYPPFIGEHPSGAVVTEVTVTLGHVKIIPKQQSRTKKETNSLEF